MKVYRVHSTVIYPDGHPTKEEFVNRSGAPLYSSPAEMVSAKERARAKEYKATKWDVVLTENCEEALRVVRYHYEAAGCSLTIWSATHFANVTIGMGSE